MAISGTKLIEGKINRNTNHDGSNFINYSANEFNEL